MERYDWRAKLSPEMSRWMGKYLDEIRQVTDDLMNTLQQIDWIMEEHKRSEAKQKELLIDLLEKKKKGIIT